MTTQKFFISSIRLIAIGALLILTSIPFSASAATPRPTCSLTVTTKVGEINIRNKKENILIQNGDEMKIVWDSRNASSVTNIRNENLLLSGVETFSLTEKATFSYRFKSGSKSVTCGVNAYVASGSIDAYSVGSNSSKSTISGTVLGTRNVQVTISNEENSKVLFKSRVIRVKNGKWKTDITKKLSDGTYKVEILGDKKMKLNTIVSAILTIDGRVAKITSVGSENAIGQVATTLVVSPVPLLFGGMAKGNAAVPVSYLQITNVGNVPASLKGFWVRQNGSAPVQSVVGFTTVDDQGGSRGATVIGLPESMLFNNGLAFAPTDAIFAPGQMRLFTIKAVMTGNVAPYIGSQLMLDVASLDTNASVIQGLFPIRGTTWTLGY